VLAPDLSGPGLDPLPATRSQEKRWTKEIRTRLAVWIVEQVMPLILAGVTDQGLTATLSAEGEKLLFAYEPLARGSGYVRPVVLLEFGARSTGEPWEPRTVTFDAATAVTGVVFPSATSRVMRPERTFWEKATAIHVFCRQGEFRGGERLSRHWHGPAPRKLSHRKLRQRIKGLFVGAWRFNVRVPAFATKGESLGRRRARKRGGGFPRIAIVSGYDNR